ncbi:unnamed protein product [Rhodiola kirilowii]
MDAYQRYSSNSDAGLPPLPPPPPSELQHPPAPPQAQWYPGQNHYQQTPQPPPPPPPGSHLQYPPQPQHWATHPTAYPNQHYPPHQLPPPNQPQMHHPPYHYSQVPSQSYSAGHQGWGNSNWVHHQGYEYQGQSNEDDWAARAKAWAAAKSAMDNQQQQSPFPQGIRTELQVPFQDQYARVAEHQHIEAKPGSGPVAYPQNPFGTENNQQVSLSDGQSNNAPGVHRYGQTAFSSASASSGPENHLAKDGLLVDQSKATIHQQEVPNSYSSITGREVGTNQNQMQFKSFPGPSNALQGGQQAPSMVLPVDRTDLVDRSFLYHNQNGNVADMPLDFAPRANISSMYPPPDIGHHRGVESPATMPVNHSWTPHLAPGSIYPSTANSGSQIAPVFGTIPGSSFPPTMPAAGGPFGPGHEISLASSTTFPVDPYGSSSASDRPKKASVPNWLKEEIYKKKVVMATSAYEYHKEETQSVEDEMGHQSFGKYDQAESKSMDSSRTAEEDDDEDYVEAARTAAINKEIKRVLTEVLMKVTDDLFDEIATKVLSEEETTEAPKQSSVNVLVLNTSKGSDSKEDSEEKSSVLPGGLLGLISYGTDSDEEKDEMNTDEQLSTEKHVKVDDDTKKFEKLDGTSSLDVINTDSINRTVVHEVVSVTDRNDRKQQNGTSSLDVNNSLRDKELSNQDRTIEKPRLEMRIASDGKDSESKMYSRRSPVKEVRDRNGENKEDQSRGKHGEKDPNKGKSDDHDTLKDKKKEVLRTDEKLSRKRSSHYDDEDKKEIERSRRVGVRDDKKRELVDNEKSERSRHKHSSNSNRHKKGHSPSPSRRRKKNKPDSSASGGSSSSTDNESSDVSIRKSLSKRRPRSPSPVRSRKRQVSRSPEHSQRRHSPYYSVEGSRRKRSRSRSPRRHR